MLIDGRTLPQGQEIRAGVCIIGSGPAGITLAQEFIDEKFDVYLVESGGLNFDPQIQSLCQGDVTPGYDPPLNKTRVRQFGGTAHGWNARLNNTTPGWRCLPLDKIDFEKRDWISYSGWPFDYDYLKPFYEKAHRLANLPNFSYKVEDWENLKSPQLFSDREGLRTSISLYPSSYPFTHTYPQLIKQAKNITALIYAHVLELETNDSGRKVSRLKISSLGGQEFWLSAEIFILAAGGIENPRLLLLSNSTHSQGLGNCHDLVGRFFMDHSTIDCGLFIPYSRRLVCQSCLYDLHQVKGTSVVGELRLTENLLRQKQILNHGIQLYPGYHGRLAKAKKSSEIVQDCLFKGTLPEKMMSHLSNIVLGGDYFTAIAFWKTIRLLFGSSLGNWSFLPHEKLRFSALELTYQIEQSPHPSNRILLSRDRDFLGQNKAEVHWELKDLDIYTIKNVMQTFQQELNSSGLGYLDLEGNGSYFRFKQVSGHHHMGTTRMHQNPSEGVVDADCRVHSVANLYIAGSSVFPTGGYANPTLTIIALAIRLAEKIKTLMN